MAARQAGERQGRRPHPKGEESIGRQHAADGRDEGRKQEARHPPQSSTHKAKRRNPGRYTCHRPEAGGGAGARNAPKSVDPSSRRQADPRNGIGAARRRAAEDRKGTQARKTEDPAEEVHKQSTGKRRRQRPRRPAAGDGAEDRKRTGGAGGGPRRQADPRNGIGAARRKGAEDRRGTQTREVEDPEDPTEEVKKQSTGKKRSHGRPPRERSGVEPEHETQPKAQLRRHAARHTPGTEWGQHGEEPPRTGRGRRRRKPKTATATGRSRSGGGRRKRIGCRRREAGSREGRWTETEPAPGHRTEGEAKRSVRIRK